MNGKILVTYVTLSGSTAECAHWVAAVFADCDLDVTVMPANEVKDLSRFDAIILGAPMIMGWHREAVHFMVENRDVFSIRPFALFSTQLHLTQPDQHEVHGVPIFMDPQLVQEPQHRARLSFQEKLALPEHGIGPVLQKVPECIPISVGFFGGKLSYHQLKLLPGIFVRFFLRAKEGDFRNRAALTAWVQRILPVFSQETMQ